MTPEQMRDASLLELFSLEAEAQTQVLSAGLLALERNPTQADQLEACMRAAHSLKGAARIVGVDAASALPMSWKIAWSAPRKAACCCARTHRRAAARHRPADAHRHAEQCPRRKISRPMWLDGRLLDPRSRPPPCVAARPAPLPAPLPIVEPLLPEPDLPPSRCPRAEQAHHRGRRAVLRVTAERLNSLLDLSSKSLVETQRQSRTWPPCSASSACRTMACARWKPQRHLKTAR
jgi:two-component system sensor histidine kinase and response regulator WspE